MACNTNEIHFKCVLRQLRRWADISTLTLVAIFGTDNASIINNIPRETFDARVLAMKRDLGLAMREPSEAELAESRARDAARAEARAKREAEVAERRRARAARDAARAKRESELVARRAERDAARAARDAEEVERIQALKRPRTKQEQTLFDTIKRRQKNHAERAANDGKVPTFQLHAGCPVAFPKKDLPRYLFLHLSAHNPGTNQQGPTPLSRKSVYCPSKKPCTACENWVQKLVEENVSVGLPGAGWAHPRDVVLKIAREVRAAFPDITFGGVDLDVAAQPAVSAPRRKRARTVTAPKKMDV